MRHIFDLREDLWPIQPRGSLKDLFSSGRKYGVVIFLETETVEQGNRHEYHVANTSMTTHQLCNSEGEQVLYCQR